VAPFQSPLSGLTETLNFVKSDSEGKVVVAIVPPSSSAMSRIETKSEDVGEGFREE
jgi:hypothetical protein